MDEEREVPLEEQLAAAEAEALSYRSLTKFQGWEMLASVLKGQADQRLDTVMQAMGDAAQNAGVDGMTRILQVEFAKGLRAGLLMAADLPRAMADFLDERVKELRMEIAAREGFTDDDEVH